MLFSNVEFPLDKSRCLVSISLFGRFRIYKAAEPVLLRNASQTIISFVLSKNRHIPRGTRLQTFWPDTATHLSSWALRQNLGVGPPHPSGARCQPPGSLYLSVQHRF